MKSDTIKRLPRPIGITQLMIEYHKASSLEQAEALDKIQGFFINQWILSHGNLCGRYFDKWGLSKFLGCTLEKIDIQMRDTFLSSKVWDKDNQEKILYALSGQALSWALEDRLEIEGQLDLLKKSQGGKYTPFVTTELNKTLGLKLQTSGNLQSLIRTMSGGGTVNIFNNTLNQAPEDQQGVSKEEALQIIQEENAKLEAPKEIQYIEDHYDIKNLPEVVANKQTGVDTAKEGIYEKGLSHSDIKAITDVYFDKMEDIEEEDHHEHYRENQEGLDIDEEDLNTTIYPQ